MSAAGFDPYERKMLGVAGLEKLLGRKDFKNLLSDLVVRQAGKPVLVPADDKRPEYVPAEVDFKDIESEGEASTTASGGNLVEAEVIRNERAVRGTVATIEDADNV